MKKLASILMTGLLLLAPMQSVHAYDNPELENMECKMQNVTTYSAKSSANYFVTLNGVRQDVTPIVQNGTTLLPVATVAKLVGYSGNWNNKTKSGTLEKDGVKIAFKLGSKSLKLTKNGSTKTISMLEPVKVIKGRTYLPLRAVGETLGMEVGYNGTTKEISLKTGSETTTETPKQPSEKIDYENLTMEEWDELAHTNTKAYNEAPYELRHKYEEWKFGISSPLKPNKPENNNTEPEQPSTPSEPEQSQEKTYSDEEIIQETLRLVNEERERLGLNKLEMRDDLNGFGKWKVTKLIAMNEMTHYPNGQGLIDQLKEYGINTSGKKYAENLTGIHNLDKRPNGPYTNWYSSKPHKDAMLNSRYHYVGIQVSKGTFDYEGNPLRMAVMILSE